MTRPREQDDFISEPIEPEGFTTALMGQGLGSMPAAFRWRGRRYEIVECLQHVKQSSREGSRAQGELYLRRQVFDVVLDSGQRARIYLERQPRAGASRESAKRRWFLYSITSGEGAGEGSGPPG